MDYRKRIVVDPAILRGKPIVAGTRIPVELILKMAAQGVGYDEMLREYPDLVRKDILVAATTSTTLT